jgi:hypothetical protein
VFPIRIEKQLTSTFACHFEEERREISQLASANGLCRDFSAGVYPERSRRGYEMTWGSYLIAVPKLIIKEIYDANSFNSDRYGSD